jgi:hypothetical protein
VSADERPDGPVEGRGKKRLTGEEKAWHLLARTLGKSVGEAKSSVSATEFVRWISLIEDEWSERKPDHFYLAQIAYWLYQILHAMTSVLGGKIDERKTVENFLLEFKARDPVKVQDAEEIETDIALDFVKSSWLTFVGVGEEEFPTRKPPERTRPKRRDRS